MATVTQIKNSTHRFATDAVRMIHPSETLWNINRVADRVTDHLLNGTELPSYWPDTDFATIVAQTVESLHHVGLTVTDPTGLEVAADPFAAFDN